MIATGVLIDHQLPRLAKLDKLQLLERVANVEAIRATEQLTVNLLIGDKEQLTQLQQLHTATHAGQLQRHLAAFPLGFKSIPFVVELPPVLHQWLMAHTWEEVRAQLINWLGALHAARCCRFKVWSNLRPAVRRWAAAHYTKYVPRQADELVEVWAREFDHGHWLAGGSPDSGVLLNPFRGHERPFLDEPAVRASYRFALRIGYFTEEDWLCIVERSRPKVRARYRTNLAAGVWTERTIDEIMQHAETDKLHRSEARQDLWQAWREHFLLVGSTLA